MGLVGSGSGAKDATLHCTRKRGQRATRTCEEDEDEAGQHKPARRLVLHNALIQRLTATALLTLEPVAAVQLCRLTCSGHAVH
ncbi:hypothetical protein EYF80_040680 [Liparis tanakae]|uniref:Uncharacterized protein n=1 Tax=Liparis tanakae TaxID=230148 RepID=A0A4Z2G6D9_9TELE|nr:hypothetical protein EYF80_040680 [Liparis tanakae]